ncbi:MAG: hypothetical protein EHM34_00310 [Nitrosopumilales archaeon]|nr:MAG: hypothetical protein EHM34_00310 [Nitrosopumilales archaeon]
MTVKVTHAQNLLSYKLSNLFLGARNRDCGKLIYFMGKYASRLLVTFMVIFLRSDIQSKVPYSTIFNHGGIGVVIGKGIKIGGHCIIGQNVTLGSRKGGVPTIGWGVVICAHSIIIGPIHVGHHSIIGAGSVVIDDIPPYSVVVGNPARVVHTIQSEEEYWKYKRGRV